MFLSFKKGYKMANHNNFTRLIFIFSLLLVLIVFSGCSSRQPGPSNNQYHTGKEGITAKFSPGSPPDTFYTGTSIPIIAEVANKGSYDTTVTLFLSGFDTNILSMTPLSPIQLSGKSRQFPEGQKVIKKITDMKATLPPGSDTFSDLQVILTACYEYETKATLQVCVDPNPASGTEKVCDASKPISLSSGQGAPVAITSIKQEPTIGFTTFQIVIQNVGGGTIISPGKAGSDCLKTTYADENKITLEKAVLSTGTKLDCGTNEIYMQNGQGFLSCTANTNIPGASDNAYKTSLTLDLKYGYRQTTDQKSINIIKGRS